MIQLKLLTNTYLVAKENREDDSVRGKTTDVQHNTACLGKMATTDTAETPFAGLTYQIQCVGRILGIEATVTTSQIRIIMDCRRKDVDGNTNDGMYLLFYQQI